MLSVKAIVQVKIEDYNLQLNVAHESIQVLTYMSIAARIRQLVEDEALESVKPEFLDPEDAPRDLYVTPEVAELFEEVDETDARGKIREVAAAVMRGFVDGDYVTLALSPFDKAATAIMARTDKVEFGIVDFRCLDPEPGLRVLCAFAEQDVCIALTWDYRENFEGDGNWPSKIADAKKRWAQLFGELSPLIAENVDAYLSYNVKAV
jgi:hypothetical protein